MSSKISILMGIYNCSDTLDEAVKSIINQSYTNWELIMCDDCSEDNTYRVALKLAESDSRIKVIKNEKNLSLAPTLNNCLKEATGEFIARMDGDDTCDSNRFLEEIKFLEKNPEFAVVSCRMNMFDDQGVFRTTNVKLYPQKKDLVKETPFCHAGCMMRTDVLRLLNGYNTSKEVERMEDYDLWFRLYLKGFVGANINKALYNMRDDRNAIKRRKLKYRIKGTRLKIRIIKSFNLPKFYYLFSLKPLLIGLLPTPIYRVLHRHG